MQGTSLKYCSCSELTCRQQLVQGPVAVTFTEDSYSRNSIRIQNLNGNNAVCKHSVILNIDSSGSISNNKLHSASGAASCLVHIAKDTITDAIGEDSSLTTLPSAEHESLFSIHRETDNRQLTVVTSEATELVDSVSSSLNSSRKLNTNAEKLRRIWHERDENNENNRSSKRHSRMVCDDDLSVFFGSPVCVFSLSAKLKTISKRKASKCKLQDVSDHLHLYNHPLMCDEHELNCSVNCTEFPEELVLPLHDPVTRNFDKPAICAYVTSNDKYAVGQSSDIELALPFIDTSQSHPVHILADMSDDISDHCSSDCRMLPCAVSALSSGSINLVLSSQNQISCCLSSASSEHDQLHLGSSVSLLCKWTDNDTLRPVCESFYTQAKCRGGYSEKPLQKLVKHNSDNKPKFLYPSAAQVSPSPVGNVLEPSSNDEDLLHAERSRSLLCRTPDVMQSGLSKAEEYMKKATSLGIVTVEDPNINAELVLTSHSVNSLQTASNTVSYGLNRIAVNSCMNTMCCIKDVNRDAVSDGSSMTECAVAETSYHRTPKTLSKDVSPESVKKSASLPSLTDSSSCSKLVHDFAGQTSPRMSHRTTVYDVGVQTSLKRLGSQCTNNVRKQPLFVNAAVQTVSVSCTCSACNSLSHQCKNKHYGFNSQESNSLRRSELWHHTSYMTNESMDCKFSVSNMDILSISSADTFENVAPFSRCAFQSAHVSGGVTAVEDHCNLPQLNSGGIKTVTMSNSLVDVEHTVGTSATVVHKNRGTGAITNAVAGHVLEVPQCVMSSESSVNHYAADFLSFDNTGEPCTTECEIASADSDPDSLTMVPNTCAQVVSNISPKSIDISFPKSFSTGFTSAGGKPLNVKLSSKLNAYKLFGTVACTEGDMLKNATHTAHFSNTDSTVSGISNTRKVGVYLTTMDAEPVQSTTSGLTDASSDNDSDCYSNGKRRTEHKNLLDHTLCACTMSMTNISSESNCDLSDVQFKSSASLTNMCSAKKNVISACVAAAAHQQPASSSEQCFTDGAADVMVVATKQCNGNACTVHADVNATYSAFNCVMLQKSRSNDIVSNGFKPFKAPRTSMQSSKYGKNNLFTDIDDCRLPDTSIAQSHSLGSVYKVNCVDETELCNLINTQHAEVVDVSLLMVNSEELFAVPCVDDINELAAEQVVTHNSTTVNVLPAGSIDEYVSTSNFFTNNDIVPKYCSPVCTMPASNSEQTCEHLLTGQVHHTSDKANTTYKIQQNSAFCSLTTSDAEDDPRDVEGCCNMPGVLMDAGFTETKPVPMVCLQSSLHGRETGAAACGKICSCINDHVSCRCASEKQKVPKSFGHRNTDFIDKRGNKHPFDGHSDINDKAVKASTDNPTNKNTPFVFFSAKGSQINVSEKMVHSIRKKWINHSTGAVNAGMKDRTMTEASYRGIFSQKNAGEMHVSSCRAEDFAVDELKTDGNCSRNMNDNKTDETPLVSVSAISIHTADVQCTSVMANKVFMPNMKSVHTVSDDADICNDCPGESAEPSYSSCLNTSIHVNDAKAAEDILPFRATNWCSDAEEVVDKRLTDRSVLKPLCTVPESKRFYICCYI